MRTLAAGGEDELRGEGAGIARRKTLVDDQRAPGPETDDVADSRPRLTAHGLAGAGIIKPRNQVHAMWNAGSTPARMIEIISPAGFEGFFRGFADLNDAGPIDPAEVAGLAADYGLPYAQPEWLAEVVENTTSPRRRLPQL